METNKVQIVLQISPEIMADIDIIYKRLYYDKNKDKNGVSRIDGRKSSFLELMIRDFIEIDQDCMAIRAIQRLISQDSGNDIPKIESNRGYSETIEQIFKMDKSKVKVKIRVLSDTKKQMDLIYKTICELPDFFQKLGIKVRVVDYHELWELAFKRYLEQQDIAYLLNVLKEDPKIKT